MNEYVSTDIDEKDFEFGESGEDKPFTFHCWTQFPDFICPKHGNIGQDYVHFTLRHPDDYFYCGRCMREFLKEGGVCKVEMDIPEKGGNTMPDKLTASEALYGFCGWLTSRKEETIMSGHHECGVIADLVKEFCNVNQLEEPRSGWAEHLIHPPGKIAEEEGEHGQG